MPGPPAPAGGGTTDTNTNKHMEGGGSGDTGGGSGGGGTNSMDPFTRKSSVKKLTKHSKKQQSSSRFRTSPNIELQPLTLLRGKFVFFQ